MQQPVPKGLQVFRDARAKGKEEAIIKAQQEIAIADKIEELRKVSHDGVTDAKLRCAAKYALGL